MEKFKNFKNKEYLKYLKNKFTEYTEKEITNLDNYIDFLSSIRKGIPDFLEKSKSLFAILKENCWLMSAEDFFNYLLELIKAGTISIEDIIYLINASYLNLGFKSYLVNYIANKEPSRFQHNMRKFSELDPIVEKLIQEYNLRQEKAI